MDIQLTEGREIVGSDDRKIGHITGTRDDCVLVETGHIFKSTHAMPIGFVHEIDGELRASVAKEIVDGSPSIEGDEWHPREVQVYYGTWIDPNQKAVAEPVGMPDLEAGGNTVDDARIAQGDDGSYAPVLPRKN
ncbi:MAG TPA: hypothetical protein VGL84_02210 [Gaiellaceae bacterium]|jgi:hypothetical protein